MEKEELGERRGEQAEQLNGRNNYNAGIDEGIYSTAISYAYHLWLAGGRNHEKSFSQNKVLADYASKIGDLDIAERCYRRAIAEAKYLGHINDSMACLYYLTAKVLFVWARYEEAVSNYGTLLKYYESVNDPVRAHVLNGIAGIHYRRGEDDQALKLYNQSLEIKRGEGDQLGIARTLNNIAGIHYRKGEYDQALKLSTESLEIARKIGDQISIGTALNNIAGIHDQKGDYDQALKRSNESLEISRMLGDQLGIADSLLRIANVHKRMGEYDQALKQSNESLEISRMLGDQQGIARTLNNIADLHYHNGEYDQALKLYNESLEISRAIGDQPGIVRTLNNMTNPLISKEKYEESLFCVLQGSKILQRLDLPAELQRNNEKLNYIKGKLGSESYQTFVNKIERQLRQT